MRSFWIERWHLRKTTATCQKASTTPTSSSLPGSCQQQQISTVVQSLKCYESPFKIISNEYFSTDASRFGASGSNSAFKEISFRKPVSLFERHAVVCSDSMNMFMAALDVVHDSNHKAEHPHSLFVGWCIWENRDFQRDVCQFENFDTICPHWHFQTADNRRINTLWFEIPDALLL